MQRTALITGGAGGLGRAVVAAFTQDGWRVVMPVRAPATVDGAAGPGAGAVLAVTADLTEPDAVAAAVARAAEDPAAPLGAVVNLAGGFAAGQPVAATPLADFEAQFTRNLRPTYLVTQAALPHLAATGGGAIVCVASRSALHPFAGAAGYCGSKAAVISFAQVVAREHAADGIRCNAVLPAMIDTPANRAGGAREGLTPPEEIAAVIRFLCGPESAPTTGAAIPVYGAP